MIEMTPKWLNTAEAATLLRTSKQGLRNMVYRRQIPGYKVHGRWMFKREELNRLIENSRRGGIGNANL